MIIGLVVAIAGSYTYYSNEKEGINYNFKYEIIKQ